MGSEMCIRDSSAIANHGITDPEIRDLVEWQFSKAMEGKAKKDKVSLATWLGGMKEGGDIPVVLKPYLGEIASAAAQPATASQPSQPAMASQPAISATASTQAQLATLTQRPTSNQGVQQTSDHATNGDMMKKASGDYAFFKANRKEVKKRYYAMRQKGRI